MGHKGHCSVGISPSASLSLQTLWRGRCLVWYQVWLGSHYHRECPPPPHHWNWRKLTETPSISVHCLEKVRCQRSPEYGDLTTIGNSLEVFCRHSAEMALLQKLRLPLVRLAGPVRVLAATYHEKVSLILFLGDARMRMQI